MFRRGGQANLVEFTQENTRTARLSLDRRTAKPNSYQLPDQRQWVDEFQTGLDLDSSEVLRKCRSTPGLSASDTLFDFERLVEGKWLQAVGHRLVDLLVQMETRVIFGSETASGFLDAASAFKARLPETLAPLLAFVDDTHRNFESQATEFEAKNKPSVFERLFAWLRSLFSFRNDPVVRPLGAKMLRQRLLSEASASVQNHLDEFKADPQRKGFHRFIRDPSRGLLAAFLSVFDGFAKRPDFSLADVLLRLNFVCAKTAEALTSCHNGCVKGHPLMAVVDLQEKFIEFIGVLKASVDKQEPDYKN